MIVPVGVPKVTFQLIMQTDGHYVPKVFRRNAMLSDKLLKWGDVRARNFLTGDVSMITGH